MGLLAKFRDRIEKSSSIEELEIVGEDFGQVRGLTADEKAKISQSLDRRFSELAARKPDSRIHGAGSPDSLDDTIDESGRQALQELRKEAASKPAVSLVVQDLSDRFDIPAGFILEFVDARTGLSRPYVTKEGLYFKLSRKGFRAVQTRLIQEDVEKGLYEFEAAIYPKLSRADYDLLAQAKDMGDRTLFREVFEELTRPTIQRGSASPVTLKEKQRKWAREIAETRATLRAVRVFTGCGLYLKEELGD